MDFLTIKCIVNLLLCGFLIGVSSTAVEDKIYVALNTSVSCVRLLNATHQIGCQSSLSGNVGILHVLESEENLEFVLSTGRTPPYLVIIESHLFTRSVMLKLKNSTDRVAGVALVAPSENPATNFSPHVTCPNENTGVYSETYGPELAHCNVTVWNPEGNGLSYEDFRFPIFLLKDDNDTTRIRQCYMDHNMPVNGSEPQYPLCAMELRSHMSAVIDTPTCMRRSADTFSLSSDKVCDPLGNYNVWASTRPINNTAKGHKIGESVVIAAARIDSHSFFFGIAPGAQSAASGFITLLAAAHALRNATQTSQPNRTILYTFFNGETFDYIGSSRMVYDMENQQFPVDLDNIHSVLEVGQVGLQTEPRLWLHSDPVSRRNSTVNDEVTNLMANLRSSAAALGVTVGEPPVSQPLPPASLQRFLLARPIPGVVIEDHQSTYANRFYQSMYDNAQYVNVSYPANLTAEQQLQFVTDTAKSLADVATMIARSLYKQAGGSDTVASGINADPQMVTRILFSFLVSSNNSWLQEIIPADFSGHLKNEPADLYVGAFQQSIHDSVVMLQHMLANLTGSTVNVTQEDCQNQREAKEDKDNKHLYYYMWVQGAAPTNSTTREGFCVRSTARTSKAVSPAMELLGQYNSRNYSTWTESRWKEIKGRIFLVASHDLEMLTLGVGVGVLLTSLLLTYFLSSKAEVLFSAGREPTNATY
ncbi:nicastrin [Synchiropus splendidus]|uniref:nicastrin n=1 Tax=Synchiropus splendidus TaxID=270530 RepID=UPI00237DEE02|nr:nicastrin [Synchiropus splendidus]